jgi:subtilase family serine protease
MHTNIEFNLGPAVEHAQSPVDGQGPLASMFANPAGFWPVQIDGAYGVSGNGGGVIAIVDAYDYPTALTDFNTFSTQFSLPTQSGANQTSGSNAVFQVVYASGSKPAQNSGWNTEEALDIEWAHAMAPSAKIVLVEATTNSDSNLYAAVQVASAIPGVREVSMSWGGGEYAGETSDDAIFSSRSILYLAATGDTASELSYPATSPNVVACGGTHLVVNGSNQWGSESAWSSGGGGVSTREPRPSYQAGVQSVVGTHRGTPDIAAVADPATAVAIYIGGWGTVGGTSVATPVLAGIHNASTTIHRSSEWTWIYNDAALFHDITSGSNGHSATTGYDLATGTGTPKASTSL